MDIDIAYKENPFYDFLVFDLTLCWIFLRNFWTSLDL